MIEQLSRVLIHIQLNSKLMNTLLLNETLTLKDHAGEVLNPQHLLSRLETLAFCVTDHEGNFLEVNEAYTQLYGYSQEELLGKHFTLVVPEAYKTYLAELHKRFIAGDVEIPTEYTVQRKDGSLVKIIAEAVRVEDPEEGTSKLTIIDVLG